MMVLLTSTLMFWCCFLLFLLFLDLESEEELTEEEVKVPPKPQLKDEAPVFTALLKDRSIETSNAARFDARVIGNPTPTVTWYKDDQEITPTKFPHIKVLQEGDLHSLLITEGGMQDSGIYKCVAKNSAGQDSTVGNLFVEGKICFWENYQGPIKYLLMCCHLF